MPRAPKNEHVDNEKSASEEGAATPLPAHLERDEDGFAVGRDPRTLTEAELNALGFEDMPLLDVIRAKCLDCCNQQPSEVKKCVSVSCALWPYRMRKNPLRRREMSEEQREAAAERLRKARLSREIEDILS